ncbi:MAG: TatD family hydrolase [Deltaproteobacteria bacterium]|jgi:TatD DNase family protein|nr:TatD family hydrolase [Deltaproteobacteria bacterium]
MNIVDSHAHLFLPQFEGDLGEVLKKARAAGVKRIVNVGLDNETNGVAIEAFKSHPGLHPAAGWHPENVLSFNASELMKLKELALLPEVVALGEIGLDYYHGSDTVEIQKATFEALLGLAEAIQKPVLIHCREAWADLFKILGPRRGALRDVVLHCYSGSLADTRLARELDCYVSFAGPITFKNADELRQIAKTIPFDKLLIETDAPFLAPVPFRGKRNEPGYLTHHIKALAQALEMEPSEAARLTAANAQRLFNFSGPDL